MSTVHCADSASNLRHIPKDAFEGCPPSDLHLTSVPCRQSSSGGDITIAHLSYYKCSLLACCLLDAPGASPQPFTFVASSSLCQYCEMRNLCMAQKKSGHQSLAFSPLVKKFRVQGSYFLGRAIYTPEPFDLQIPHQFSSLTNVQEPEIDSLDTPNFTPHIRRYFHCFLPTVRSLALGRPRGPRRQIIFIGLF